MNVPDWLTKPESIFAFASALAAWVAMFFAWSSARSTRRQASILYKQDLHRGRPLDVRLESAHIHIRDDINNYTFTVAVLNPAEVENAITRLELWIVYSRNEVENNLIKIPHHGGQVSASAGDATQLPIPVVIGVRSAVQGVVRFQVPKSLLADCEIQRYIVRLEDSLGASSEASAIILDTTDSAGGSHG